MRPSQRSFDQLREIRITRHYTKHAEGSVLVEFGNTKVLCNASIENTLPRWLRNKKQGWVTAEYGMLPRATHTRTEREATHGRQTGRTQEIQRLIGRSLRAAVDLSLLGENTITIDCDVIQADGGTRTAAITGACVALVDALNTMQRKKQLLTDPLRFMLAAISVGIYQGHAIVDLDYAEDSKAHTDMNVVMNEAQGFIEIQGTAESRVFSEAEHHAMLALAKQGILTLIKKQREALAT